ncbi:hypothetical protein ACFL5O_02690 [Myxococcota bacterium]
MAALRTTNGGSGADVKGDPANDLRDLIELAQHVVHKKFALATCLRPGPAIFGQQEFHNTSNQTRLE